MNTWYWANKEKHNKKVAEWKANNRERWLAYRRKWRLANKERLGKARKEYYAANREDMIAKSVQWGKDNKDKRKALYKRSYVYYCRKRLSRYGMTPESYDAMVLAQDGLCGICKRPPTKGKLFIDHNHKTGKVRELLCVRCNNLLGICDESVDRLKVCIAYIERHNAAESSKSS